MTDPRVYYWLRDYIMIMETQRIIYPQIDADGAIERKIKEIDNYLLTWKVIPPEEKTL